LTKQPDGSTKANDSLNSNKDTLSFANIGAPRTDEPVHGIHSYHDEYANNYSTIKCFPLIHNLPPLTVEVHNQQQGLNLIKPHNTQSNLIPATPGGTYTHTCDLVSKDW